MARADPRNSAGCRCGLSYRATGQSDGLLMGSRSTHSCWRHCRRATRPQGVGDPAVGDPAVEESDVEESDVEESDVEESDKGRKDADS